MKTTTIKLFLIPVGLFLLSSCVSSRKYTESQKEIKQYKDQAAVFENRNLRLKHTNESLMQEMATIHRSSDEKFQVTDLELQKDKKALADLQAAVKMEETQVSSIRQQLCDALKCFTPDEVTIKERGGELYVSMYDKLLFPTGSTKVNERGKKALKILSGVLKNNNMKIMVEGHTDSLPIHTTRFNDNWDLSVIRATSVLRVLTKEDKLDPARIIASGKGKFQPFYSNKTALGRKLNRRTDIVLVPRLEELYSLINQDNNLKLSSNIN